MGIRNTLSFVLLSSILVPAASIHADTLELGGGIQVGGKIVRQIDNGPKPSVVIEVDPELRIAVPQQRIRKTVSTSDEKLVWYQQALAKIPADAEAHYEFARECKANGLNAQCDYHFRRAIEFDPNHSKARAALNFARDGNEWVLFAELQESRGLISTASGWQVPEVYVRAKQVDEATEAAKRWVKELAKLRSGVLGRGKRSEESLAAIQAIDDPLASMAIAEVLEKSAGNDPDPKELRRVYVKKLGELKTSTAVQTLVRIGLYEPDPGIRIAALEELQQYGAASAVASYLPMLKNEKHKKAEVTAALRALNFFPDPELWRDYIDALVTEHKRLTPKGPGMSVGSNSLGGSGLSTGSKQEVITEYQQNPGALELLRQIAPGVDYRYDQAAWREHFAQQLLGATSDLRRDP